MRSEPQIEANRKNGLASTGPRTPDGKARVSRNAIRHGIFAQEAVITDGDGEENAAAYRRLHAELIEDLAPVGQMEHLLVEKIAVNYWRLRRVVRYETGRIRRLLDDFMQDALNRQYGGVQLVSSLPPSTRAPQPMEMYRYGDRITNSDYKMQLATVDALRCPDTDLASNDNFLEYVYYNHFEPARAAEYADGGEAVPDSEWERARQWVKALSSRKRARLRRELLELEEQALAEMEEVRLWNRRFEIVARSCSLPQADEIEKVTKYEAALERSIFRNLAALKSLQATRGSARENQRTCGANGEISKTKPMTRLLCHTETGGQASLNRVSG